ncbi:MAG: hypothetical protein LBV19_04885 [Streptococcaceae bacterium]|jgi:hypothetical protein|nr:hypothetical protein [Streptococcaceae bacterium]
MSKTEEEKIKKFLELGVIMLSVSVNVSLLNVVKSILANPDRRIIIWGLILAMPFLFVTVICFIIGRSVSKREEQDLDESAKKECQDTKFSKNPKINKLLWLNGALYSISLILGGIETSVWLFMLWLFYMLFGTVFTLTAVYLIDKQKTIVYHKGDLGRMYVSDVLAAIIVIMYILFQYQINTYDLFYTLLFFSVDVCLLLVTFKYQKMYKIWKADEQDLDKF